MSETPLPSSLPSADALHHDSNIVVVGMAALALTLGLMLGVSAGNYNRQGVELLGVSTLVCLGTLLLPRLAFLEWLAWKAATPGLTAILCLEWWVMVMAFQNPLHQLNPMDVAKQLGFSLVIASGLMATFSRPNLKWPLIAIMLAAFAIVALRPYDQPSIDVFQFQQRGIEALLHGKNPYDWNQVRYVNVYDPVRTQEYYGKNVVGSDGIIQYGFPYPPTSLLLAMPGYLVKHDVRFADLAAVLISAALMAAARPGRWGVLAAAIFLMTLQVDFVIRLGWTEPLLALTFSITMYCACRKPKALPYALGLWLATKQYAILGLPAACVLLEGRRTWHDWREILIKALGVAVVLTLPFFLWNPHQFWRSVVQWQFVQPFRQDALSYLVFYFHRTHGYIPPIWTPLLAVAPAIAIGLWRAARTPAGFAAAVTLAQLVFFAFNKQAFCNYYFFLIATSCWAVAASQPAAKPAHVPAAACR